MVASPRRPWTVLPVEAIAAGRFFLPAMGRGIHSPVYVDDLAAPAVRVRVADLLRQGGERPIQIARRGGAAIRVVLLDTKGVWAKGAPRLEVSLS